MSFITLIIRFPNTGNSYILKLDDDIAVDDLCLQIFSKIPNEDVGNPDRYGIFITDPDPKHSFWLENSRMLSYYHLLDNSEVEYRSKMRLLVVQTVDSTRKTLQIDDSKTVAELMSVICAKMGITNHEEYSLIRPIDEEKMRTLTLRKKKNVDRDQEKLEKLKQKLHTDDDLNWLVHGKTLRQHGVEESDVLILRRKYFFADKNVDTRDPVQLNLLYMQLKEAIIKGTHPISLEQAIQLAALQCQSELGVLTDEKAKLNPVDLNDHLPKEYRKVKNVDKRIQEVHKNLENFDEREAKLRYVQLCRSLPTYGIAFFLIKEKTKGRNKLVPRLLGISKESVMRVDEKTKEILESWPLTHIRRWAVGVNLFILDFGDNDSDGNYAVKTTEAEQIGHLISGYIDIILRRQRGRHTAPTDGDENTTIVEENVAPSRANVIANLPGTLHRNYDANIAQSGTLRSAGFRSDVSEDRVATDEHAVVQQNVSGACVGSGRIIHRNGFSYGEQDRNFQVVDLAQPKRGLISRIESGLRTILEATNELQCPIYPDDSVLRGNDDATMRWRMTTLEQAQHGVYSHLGAMTMATGQLLACLQPTVSTQSGEDYDYTSMDASLVSIGMNVNGLMQCIRLYDQIDAASGGDRSCGADLKQAAQLLSDAFLGLIRAARPAEAEKASSLSHSSSSLSDAVRNGGLDRVALLEAASRVGDASRQLLQLISVVPLQNGTAQTQPAKSSLTTRDEENLMISPFYSPVVDWEARDRLLSATKAVASQMAHLVKLAKSGAMALGREVVECAAADLHSGVIGPLRSAQSALVQAATTAGKSASRLVTCAKVVVCAMEQPESQEQLIRTVKEVSASANGVTEAVDDLIRMSLDAVNEDGNAVHESHLRLGDDLHEAVLGVHSSLTALVDCLRSTTIQAHQNTVVSTLLSVGTQLPASVGDGLNLVNKATSLAAAASSLMSELRSEAALDHSQTGLSSVEAVRRADLLDGQIRHLTTIAKQCADGNVQSLEHQHMVVRAAQQLFTTAQAAAAPIIRARLTQGLEFATRLTASNVGPLVTIGGEVIRICQGNTYKLASNLEQLQKHVMPQISLSCAGARGEPYNTQKQADLLVASQRLMEGLEEMLRLTDAIVPTIPDPGVQSAFSSATRNTQACLTDLRLCFNNSEGILGSDSLALEATALGPNTEEDDELRTAILSKSIQCLDSLAASLRLDSTKLLPDETLDSVAIGLWNAVGRFNRSFPTLETATNDTAVDTAQELDQLPALIARLFTRDDQGWSTRRDWNRISSVVNELVERIKPVIGGIRGLVAFFATAASAPTLASRLSRVLLVSRGLAIKRQSGLSSRSSQVEPFHLGDAFFSTQEHQAQETAHEMLEHLLSIGESCLAEAGQVISWALQPGPISRTGGDTHQMIVTAAQLSTSVNATLGYVLGEVLVRRLVALLEDTVDSVPNALASHHTDDVSYSQTVNAESYTRLTDAARRLTRVLDVACHLSESAQSSEHLDEEMGQALGSDSKLVLLAHLTDRITCALAEVIRAANACGDSTEKVNPLLLGLSETGHPVATALRYAMRTMNGEVCAMDVEYGHPPPDILLPRAILHLRDWAVELSLQANVKAASLEAPSHSGLSQSSWSTAVDSAEATAHVQMRGQCEASVRRVNTLLRLTSLDDSNESDRTTSVSTVHCPIRLPTTNQTFPECMDYLCQLDEEIKHLIDSIPPAASKRDTDSFCAAVKGVAQATCQLLQVTNQAAYLVGAAHPASKPGHTGRLPESNQLTKLHDHIAAVREFASELSRTDATVHKSGDSRSSEVMNIATNAAQRATELCRSTRPLLSDCKTSAERKTLAESLERVARAAATLFRTTQRFPTDSDMVFRQLELDAMQLEEAVDQYADVLFRTAGGSPTQLAEQAFELQVPILDCGQLVVQNSARLLEQTHNFIGQDQDELAKATDTFLQSRQTLYASIGCLKSRLLQAVPGTDACDTVRSHIGKLLTSMDNVALSITASDRSTVPNAFTASRVEPSLGLIRSSLQQIEKLAGDAVDNWSRGHWELMSHNIHDFDNYLPSLVKECSQSAMGLIHSSDQSSLLSRGRTVLEAAQQLVDCLAQDIRSGTSTMVTDQHPIATDYARQLGDACKELLVQVDTIAKLQGGISWHLASITEACSKLDDPASPKVDGMNKTTDSGVSLPTTFVHCHTRLGHQSRALVDAAKCVAQVHTISSTADPTVRANAIASMAQLFVQMTDTTQSISDILLNHSRTENGITVARKLCHLVQAVGASCCEFLRSPSLVGPFDQLIGRLDDLKATLQFCAPGADACTTAATHLGRLAADLDTAALFARAGTLVDPVSPMPGSHFTPNNDVLGSQSSSTRSDSRGFQAAQEVAVHAIKDFVEDLKALVQNSTSDQDALAVSAQNCLLRASTLTETIKSVASRAANVPVTPPVKTNACTEYQVQLLTIARDVITNMVQLLNQGRTVAATRYAIEAWCDAADGEELSSRQKVMNDMAVHVVESLSRLSQSLRSLANLVTPPKPTINLRPPPIVPPKRTTSIPSPLPSSTGEENVEKTGVLVGLQSLLDALTRSEERSKSWSVQDRTFLRPASDSDFHSEQQSALGVQTSPQQLISATRAITQAAIAANNATSSGKLQQMSMAGHLLRKACEDLFHTIPAACRTALQSCVYECNRSASDRRVSEDETDVSLQSIQTACDGIIGAGTSTFSELRQLVEHMIKSLDAGSSTPASIQVTLAMRRLRETVHEIVENALRMPGAKDSSSVEVTPAIAPKPIPVLLSGSHPNPANSSVRPLIPHRPCSQRSSLLSPAQQQDEVERSIADANATASDVPAIASQQELTAMASELERNVHRIGQLHSRRAGSSRKTVRFTPSTTTGEGSTTDPTANAVAPLTPSDGTSIVDSTEGLDSVIAACQHVVHTTLSIMYWAAAAQRELVQQGRLKPVDLSLTAATGGESESQWAQGLISAARYVAAAANCVVESAQAMVAVHVSTLDGGASSSSSYTASHDPKPEALISAAQTTAACTAQLVVACVAKADPSSKSCIGLRQSGTDVKRATDRLVRLVQALSKQKAQGTQPTSDSASAQSLDGLGTGMVASMRQVIETKSSIAAKQKELDDLHKQLKHIHQDQYKSHLC